MEISSYTSIMNESKRFMRKIDNPSMPVILMFEQMTFPLLDFFFKNMWENLLLTTGIIEKYILKLYLKT